MNPTHQPIPSIVRGLILILAVAISHPALCEPGAENAQGLLEKARQSDYERKMAVKQTELDRLNEDLKKGKEQAEGLHKMIDSVGVAIAEANGRLERVTAQRNHQPKVMEVLSLKYEAEKLRVDGLKLLEIAQKKAADSLAKHNEVTDLRTTLGALEMKLYAEKALAKPGEIIGAEHVKKSPQTGGEVRKNLAAAERSAASAESAAREAMQAATAKLQQADAAAEKAEKRKAELGIEDISNLPVDKPGTESATLETPKKRAKH